MSTEKETLQKPLKPAFLRPYTKTLIGMVAYQPEKVGHGHMCAVRNSATLVTMREVWYRKVATGRGTVC